MQTGAVVIGTVGLMGGLLSVGAGAAGWREQRRIRDTGVAVWAQVSPSPSPSPQTAAGDKDESNSASRPLLRYTTEDGRDLEVFSPMAPTRAQPLAAGRPVLVHYDPKDPTQIVVHGARPFGDLFFIVFGALVAVGTIVFMVLTG